MTSYSATLTFNRLDSCQKQTKAIDHLCLYNMNYAFSLMEGRFKNDRKTIIYNFGLHNKNQKLDIQSLWSKTDVTCLVFCH